MEWTRAITQIKKKKRLLTCSLAVVLQDVFHMSIPHPTLLSLYVGAYHAGFWLEGTERGLGGFIPLASSMSMQGAYVLP